jgi:hypothetical protein
MIYRHVRNVKLFVPRQKRSQALYLCGTMQGVQGDLCYSTSTPRSFTAWFAYVPRLA